MNQHINLKTGRPFAKGARPTPRHRLAAAMPFRPRGTPPASFMAFPLSMNMLGNDVDGDCVTAEEGFNKQCFGVNIAYQTAVNWAQANGVLNGADLDQVIQMMQSSGFSQDGNTYNDGPGLAVNYADQPTMTAAIWEAVQAGGCVKCGIASDALPSVAGNANGWVLTGAGPDSNEDHCMGACGVCSLNDFAAAMQAAFGVIVSIPSGYDPTTIGYVVYTWATIGWADVQSWTNISGEAWVRSPSSLIVGTNTPSPDQVYSTVTPTPPNPPVPPVPPVPPTPPTGLCTRPLVLMLETILAYANSLPLPLPSWLQVAVTDAENALQVLCPSGLQRMKRRK